MNKMKAIVLMVVMALTAVGGGFNLALAGTIHEAANKGDVRLVALLLDAQPELANLRDEDGMTPLHYAALNGNRELLATLIAKAGDVNAADNSGQTPLHMAVVFRNRDAAEVLLDAGARVDASDSSGQTALHVAAMNGFGDLVLLLMARGASLNARDNGGQTPLHKAATYGQMNIAQMLIDAHADVNPVDESGITPMGAAQMNHFDKVAALLREHGGIEMIVAQYKNTAADRNARYVHAEPVSMK